MRSCASLALVFRRQPLAVLIAALCASGVQAADAPADKEVNLGTVTVTGNSDYQPPTEGTGLYTTRKSSSATGLKLPFTAASRLDRPKREPMSATMPACETKVSEVLAMAPPKAPNIGR